MAEAPRFSVGVDYWPRSRATAMWRDFDAGEIDADFAQIAAYALDTVRIFLNWDDFAPDPAALDPLVLERFATVVERAAANGLRVLPVLFAGHITGTNFVPVWALDRRRTAGRFRSWTAAGQSPYGCGDLYSGALLEAQRFFCRTIGERWRGHPAIAGWDIGHAFSRLCEPSAVKVSSGDHSTAPASERAVATWSATLAAALHESSGHAVTAGTTADDLTADRSIRLGSLCAPLTFASMQGDTLHAAFARGRLDLEAVPFLAAVTAAFSFKSVLVTGFGNPTCPPGKFSAFERFPQPGEPPHFSISPDDTAFATHPCLTEDECALYAAGVLERLHADGRLGAFWWCWSDYPAELAARPPFDVAPEARSCGLVRADGSPKPAAAALSAFAREGRTVRKPNDMPMIAGAYYYRTLPTSTTTLYDAYLGDITERRASR